MKALLILSKIGEREFRIQKMPARRNISKKVKRSHDISLEKNKFLDNLHCDPFNLYNLHSFFKIPAK